MTCYLELSLYYPMYSYLKNTVPKVTCYRIMGYIMYNVNRASTCGERSMDAEAINDDDTHGICMLCGLL